MAKMNIQKVWNEYAEELEMMQKKQSGIDPLWDTWYAESVYYEPAMEAKIETDEVTTKEKNTTCRKKNSNRANRRRMTFYHNQKLRRNAQIILDSYYKRSAEDMHNASFCKKRGGRRVINPKSYTYRAEDILKRAEKMQLIQTEPNDTENIQNMENAQSKAA